MSRTDPTETMQVVDTPTQRTIEEVSQFLKVDIKRCLKTLIVLGNEGLTALVLCGNHTLNPIKAAKHPLVRAPLTFATPEQIREVVGCDVGFLGPVGLNIPLLVDVTAAFATNFVCGANQDGQHLTGVNWARDLPEPQTFDLRNVEVGDVSPDGFGTLEIMRGIEVGHIFQLGQKYSRTMQATVLDEAGKAMTLFMGCYGIGVSRIVAAAIEQNHDEQGIIWTNALAPFTVALLPMNMHKSYRVQEATEKLYQALSEVGIEVLFDDRKERAGVMFADMELMGIPHRLVVSERGLDDGKVEYKGRTDKEPQIIPLEQAITFLQDKLRQ